MDSKQFDELVARLASASSRRSAVKGVIGGALASAGVTSVAAKNGGKGKGKGGQNKNKGKGKKTGKGQASNNGDSNGHGYGLAKVQICHKGRTIEVAEPAVSAHLAHGDTLG